YNKSLCHSASAILACGVRALFKSCSGRPAAPPSNPTVPVMAAVVEQKDVPLQVKAIGSVEAYSNVSIKTQIPGELTGVFFKEGDDVKKGQLLFTLDKRPLAADMKRAEGMLAKDQ